MLSSLRIGGIFDAQPEFYTLMAGLASIAGLGGVWLIKKWKDEKFALPLFLAAQFAQAAVLAASFSIFVIHLFEPSIPPLWHLAPFFVWGLACAFYVFSNLLYPFFLFPWLAAGALVMPEHDLIEALFGHINTGNPSGPPTNRTITYDFKGDGLLSGVTTTVIPEPGTLALFGTGLVGLAGAIRRRMSK
ncbi:MAG: PEP-CTERM sorting domain-containing protein [Anaerolineaceae bacterium]|nr:MAG: PEP-CTERM sorting domain-containing protein [Anaerolineaceae bacterium]